MRKTAFSIDFFEGKVFEGLTTDKDWNGFACPYFTFNQAQSIVDAWKEQGLKAGYEEREDLFFFEVMAFGDDDEECIENFASTEIEGLKLYPIGASCWIWSEAS